MTQNEMAIVQLITMGIIGGGLGLVGYVITRILKKGEKK